MGNDGERSVVCTAVAFAPFRENIQMELYCGLATRVGGGRSDEKNLPNF